MTTPRTPRSVIVRLPGPPSDSDPFGMRWLDPEGHASLGEVEVRAEFVEALAGGSALVRLGGEEREAPASRWRFPGKLQPSHRTALLNAVEAIAGDSDPAVDLVARTVAAIVIGNGVVERAQEVIQAAQRPGATSGDKRDALLLLACAWISEESR